MPINNINTIHTYNRKQQLTFKASKLTNKPQSQIRHFNASFLLKKIFPTRHAINSIKKELATGLYPHLTPTSLNNKDFATYTYHMVFLPCHNYLWHTPLFGGQGHETQLEKYDQKFTALQPLITDFAQKNPHIIFTTIRDQIKSFIRNNHSYYLDMQALVDSTLTKSLNIEESLDNFLINTIIKDYKSLEHYRNHLIQERKNILNTIQNTSDQIIQQRKIAYTELKSIIQPSKLNDLQQYYRELGQIKNTYLLTESQKTRTQSTPTIWTRLKQIYKVITNKTISTSKSTDIQTDQQQVIIKPLELQTKFPTIYNNINILFDHILFQSIGSIYDNMQHKLKPLPVEFLKVLKNIQIPNYTDPLYNNTLKHNLKYIRDC